VKFFKLLMLVCVAVPLSLNAADVSSADKALKKELMGQWKAYAKAAQKEAAGISAKELAKWMDEDKDFVLVDVREPKEVAAGVIMAMEWKAIPRGMVAPAVGKAMALKPSQTVVIYCKLGARSAMAANELKKVYGFKNVYYLKGGIMGWIKDGYEIHNMMGEFKVSK
jgi:rhodanese-related sulfurtransferase